MTELTNISSLQDDFTAATNTINYAHAALKSAGIEADTLQDGVMQLVKKLEAMNDLAAENAVLKSVFDTVTDLGNEPEFHYQGMGCGLEDRGITDRYEAMKYGWDEAMERVYGEVIPSAEEVLFPATDAFLNSARAEGVELFASKVRGGSAISDRVIDLANDFAAQLRTTGHADKAGE